MLPDWVLNPGPLTYESGALPIALCGPANFVAGKDGEVLDQPVCLIILPSSHLLYMFQENNTAELQRLNHLGKHENIFETGVARANKC